MTTRRSLKQYLAGSGKRELLANTAWLLGDKSLRLAVGVLVGAWVARYLGPAEYGELAYVITYMMLFSTVALLGLDGIVIRELAAARQPPGDILGSALRLRLLAGFVCWLASLLIIWLIRPGDLHTLLLVAIICSSVMFQAGDTVDLWFQSQTRSRITVIAKGASFLIVNALRVLLILQEQPLTWFVLTYLIEAMLNALLLTISYHRTSKPASSWRWHVATARQMLHDAWPFLISAIGILLYMRVDQIMLRELRGEHDLGIYSAATQISTALYFIPTAICMSLGPVISRKLSSDRSGYYRNLGQLFTLMWWLVLPICLFISFASGHIIRLLYGEPYAASADVLALHVFCNLPFALGMVQARWAFDHGRGILSIQKTLTGLALNVLLNFWLIPAYGALGAAMASLAAALVSSVLINCLLARPIFLMQVGSLVGRMPPLSYHSQQANPNQ